MHLSVELHVEHQLYRVSQLDEGLAVLLDEVSDELKKVGGEVYDYFLDYDNANVIIDIFPESVYSMLMLTDHWLKDYIRKD